MVPSNEAHRLTRLLRGRIEQFHVSDFGGGGVMVFWENLPFDGTIPISDSIRVDRWDFRERDMANRFIEEMAMTLALEDLRDQDKAKANANRGKRGAQGIDSKPGV
jgi:hypothetical protein